MSYTYMFGIFWLSQIQNILMEIKYVEILVGS